MSLLINALKKAESDKKAADVQPSTADSLSLELAPRASESKQTADDLSIAVNTEPAKALSSSTEEKLDKQKAAGNLFQVKNPPAKKSPILLYGGLSIGLLLIVMGGFYYYLETLTPTNIVIANKPITEASNQSISTTTQPAVPTVQTPAASGTTSETESTSEDVEQIATEQQASTTADPSSAVFAQAEKSHIAETAPSPPKTTVSSKQSTKLAFGDTLQGLPENNKLNITRKAAENTINPNLLAAYSAYNLGDDTQAQQLYRRVLQVDSRNIDALLGMAAIAARQGRLNDANGWYAKVLEVEPRNSFALAAMSELGTQTDPISAESKLKGMLAQQPQAAHLHAALGQLYLEQGQWGQAQAAYFEAHHYAPNQADYAYNLAICLDQMGKGTLALPYYQKALLLAKSTPNSIDANALELRIQALEAQ